MLPWLLLALILPGLAALLAARRFAARNLRDVGRVLGAAPAAEERVALPARLGDYLARTRLPEGEGMRWFRITQTGEMRLKPDGPWQAFEAVQHCAVGAPWFVWTARFRSFRVVDSLVDGTGRLEARLFGVLPVAKATGPAISRAQLMRYLSEVAWFPRAITANPFVSWQETGGTGVRGVLEHGGRRVELAFRFDGAGDLVEVEGLRERAEGTAEEPLPWIGTFSDHGTVGGVRIPRRAEVRWELPSGPFTYWRGRVTGLEPSPAGG